MNRLSSDSIRTIDLDHEQLLVLEDRRGARVRVLSGGLWLTEEGQLDDRFARPGDQLLLTGRGRAVLEGMGPARIEVAEPARRFNQRLRERIVALRAAGVGMRGLASVISLALALGLPELVARGFQQGGDAAPPANAAAAAARTPSA